MWAGWQLEGSTLIEFAVVPRSDHGWGHVRVGERDVLAAARAARGYGAGILAQVHSHPGRDTRHSDGDDELVLMPFEGMWSVVVAEYGLGMGGGRLDVGIHQRQGRRWTAVTDMDEALVVLPPAVHP
ncbi:MAG: hypothetical protein U0838_06955 [Chloroflexota bacterium]